MQRESGVKWGTLNDNKNVMGRITINLISKRELIIFMTDIIQYKTIY